MHEQDSPFAVQNGRLKGARFLCSPHADARPDGVEPRLLIVHGISLPAGTFSGDAVTHLFLGTLDCAQHPDFADLDGLRVSAHLFVRRDGEVLQFVPFEQRAWHAGASLFRGSVRCNDFSIGIELEGCDTTPYTGEQYTVLVDIVRALQRAYPEIRRDTVVGHCHVAPGRKTDPGPAFDWPRLLWALPSSSVR